MRLIPKHLRELLHLDTEEEEEAVLLTEKEYHTNGVECLERAWTLLIDPDWKEEKRVESTGDVVYSRVVKGRKVWKVHGIVNAPAKFLLEELFFNIESSPKWNPQLTDCKTIQSIDSHTDISYQVSAEAGGGMISTRDFVNLRHWDVRREESGDGEVVYITAGISIKHPAMPQQPKRVRGENGPNCMTMRALPGDPDRSLFRFVLDTDIKGWIPQKVIDATLSGALIDYLEALRRHADKMTQSGAVADFMAREEGHAYASLNVTNVNVSSAEIAA